MFGIGTPQLLYHTHERRETATATYIQVSLQLWICGSPKWEYKVISLKSKSQCWSQLYYPEINQTGGEKDKGFIQFLVWVQMAMSSLGCGALQFCQERTSLISTTPGEFCLQVRLGIRITCVLWFVCCCCFVLFFNARGGTYSLTYTSQALYHCQTLSVTSWPRSPQDDISSYHLDIKLQ